MNNKQVVINRLFQKKKQTGGGEDMELSGVLKK